MAKQLATQGTKELTEMEELFDGASSGFEGTSPETFKTPFLKILQAMSPELKKTDSKYIPGAEQGDFCNSATQELYKELNVVVLKVEHVLIAWRPQRGGFVGRYTKDMEDKVVATKEGVKKWDTEGNEVIDTIEFYCMNADNPMDIFIFPMSTASLKYAKSFATRLRMLTVDGTPVKVSWAGVWNIKTTEDHNDLGSWYTLGLTPDFVRIITVEEKNNFITPAKEMLEKAETDYSVVDDKVESSDSVEY